MAGLSAAAAGLAGCQTVAGTGAAAAATTSTGTSAGPPSTAMAHKPIDYHALAKRLSGKLILPGDPGYPRASQSYNPNFDGRKPAAIAQVANPADVQRCVEAAAESGTPIAARSGGHSYAGYSTPNGALVVDLANLHGVALDRAGNATIGAGTKLAEVYDGVAGAGRALPGGSCPTVGIAGLTLGGGVGVLTRAYGLTCDRLVSAQLVTADGRLRTVSANAEPDLFWALRGGGGGNLGIVTSLAFRTEAAPPQLAAFTVRFGGGTAADVFGAWQQWLPNSPAALWTKCTLVSGSSPSARLTGCYIGSTSALTPLLNDLIKRTSATPTGKTISGLDYASAMRYFAGSSARESFAASSSMLRRPADAGKIASIATGETGSEIMFDALGGAVAALKPTDTAFAHRSSLATTQIYRGSTPSTAPAATKTVDAMRDALTGVLGVGGYVNYIDPTMPNWGSAYYGDNLSKLHGVARRYDPHGVFTFAQSIEKAR
ncbi:MAG: FAD-binding oxidoreductase [Sciscionella sp.]|nr:FAD-binding oxidoreductase [Sciscionella sp.]